MSSNAISSPARQQPTPSLPNIAPKGPLSAATMPADVRYSGQTRSAAPRFGNLGPDAWSNLAYDTAAILGPKVLVSAHSRGKKQVSEDIGLEAIEDAAFYLSAPVVGHYALAPVFKKLAATSEPLTKIGTPLRQLAQTSAPIGKSLLGAKLGTLAATLAVAVGAEYLVYFAKNLISVGLYNTKNFEAVAGLEKSKSEVEAKHDPVLKARTRLKQVSAVTAAAVAGAATLPALVKRGIIPEKIAKNILHHIDFSASGKQVFQLSKPFFAAMMASGYVAGLDSARSNLERWENGLRIAGVIGFLLAGRELAGNAIAGALEQTTVLANGTKQKLGSLVKLTDPKLFQKESVLNFSKVRPFEAVKAEVKALSHLSPATQKAIISRAQYLEFTPTILAVLVSGVTLTALSYAQTRWRYNRLVKANQVAKTPQQAVTTKFTTPSALPTAPLSNLNSRNAFASSFAPTATPSYAPTLLANIPLTGFKPTPAYSTQPPSAFAYTQPGNSLQSNLPQALGHTASSPQTQNPFKPAALGL
ncbi:MAG: hypothetical protein VKJ06_07555 [Vampirovibrionales bacterium]|nr:hypothetical protein [Vampirovibrionales bacterium]